MVKPSQKSSLKSPAVSLWTTDLSGFLQGEYTEDDSIHLKLKNLVTPLRQGHCTRRRTLIKRSTRDVPVSSRSNIKGRSKSHVAHGGQYALNYIICELMMPKAETRIVKF
jgi:hypothetical protein